MAESDEPANSDWWQAEPDVAWLVANTGLAGAEFHTSIPTSQTRARELHQAGVPLPYLVIAESMPEAIGRRSRAWWTGRGSLAMTLLWRPATPCAEPWFPAVIALSTAIAVIDMAAAQGALALQPGRDIVLHWPNDVYLHGRKVSGVLSERYADGTFALGLGVNINNRAGEAPAELRTWITSFADEAGRLFDRRPLLVELLRRLLTLGELACTPPGRAVIIRRANELCVQTGRNTVVRAGEHSFTGVCAGIDDEGSLLLENNGERRAFPFGEIVTTYMP